MKRQHLGMGVRQVNPETGNRKSSLWMVFESVQQQFAKWRMSGQYVDRDDLLAEFDFRLGQKIEELEAERLERPLLQDAEGFRAACDAVEMAKRLTCFAFVGSSIGFAL